MENGLETILNAQIDFRLSDIYVTMVAEVTNTSKLKECRIDVQPVVNKKYIDGEILEYTEILSIPVQFPCSSTSALTFPINQGDNVLLVFSQKGLDVFKSGATSAHDPIDMRSFDKRDAIAIPCVFPFSKSINNPDTRTLIHSVDDMVMVHNIGKENECEVRLTSGGEVKITGVHTKVSDSLAVGGSVTVGTGATGSFTTPLGQVVTVTDGIITNIF
jgi:Phage protein Gp138 N-terminal domain